MARRTLNRQWDRPSGSGIAQYNSKDAHGGWGWQVEGSNEQRRMKQGAWTHEEDDGHLAERFDQLPLRKYLYLKESHTAE